MLQLKHQTPHLGLALYESWSSLQRLDIPQITNSIGNGDDGDDDDDDDDDDVDRPWDGMRHHGCAVPPRP